MSIRFYDAAISEKIANQVKDPNMKILKPDEVNRLQEIKFDETKDEPLKLPIIAISRDKSIEIQNAQKQTKTFNGFIAEASEKRIIPINVIPIQIGYQIDIVTRGMAEADEYIRNFIFNFINYPRLEIELPYNDLKIRHEAHIKLEPTVLDNSDVKEHLFPDQFVRFSIRFSLDDAYLFSMPTITPVLIEGYDIRIVDGITGEVEEKL